MKNFAYFVSKINRYANPAIAYFNCLFYWPRLVSNLAVGLKHLVPNSAMSLKEQELDILTRLIAQLHRRWFELSNDSVWCVAAVLNCFLLIGPLAPVGVYLTIALFAYDVELAGVRAFLELGRISELKKDYLKIRDDLIAEDAPVEEIAEAVSYLAFLQKRFVFEQKRLLLSVASTSALFLAMCFAAPILAFNPIIPLIGACLMITITLVSYILNRLVEAQRPSDKVTHLAALPQRFFNHKQEKAIEADELNLIHHSFSANDIHNLTAPEGGIF